MKLLRVLLVVAVVMGTLFVAGSVPVNAQSVCPGSAGCPECSGANPPGYCKAGTTSKLVCPGSAGCPECSGANPPGYCEIATSNNQGGAVTFDIPNPLSCDEANCLVNRIFTILWVIAFPLVTIMILFGAYQLMFSRGNPETVEAGRKTIQWAVIGFIVLVSARLIVAIVFATVGAVVK